MDHINRVLDTTTKILGMIVGAGGISYVLGFIITNNSLLQFGLASFELFQARYIASGILFSMLIFIFLAEPIYDFVILWQIRSLGQKISRRRVVGNSIVSWIWLVFIVLVLSIILNLAPITGVMKPFGNGNDLLAEKSVSYFAENTIDLFQRLLLWGTLLFLIFKWCEFEIIGGGWIRPKDTNTRPQLRTSLIVFPAIIGFPVALFLLVYYSLGVYPYIPQSFGGGAPLNAQLVISATQANAVHGVDLSLTPVTTTASAGEKTYLTEEILIFDQSATNILAAVRRPTGVVDVMVLDRKLVLAIKYLSPIR